MDGSVIMLESDSPCASDARVREGDARHSCENSFELDDTHGERLPSVDLFQEESSIGLSGMGRADADIKTVV